MKRAAERVSKEDRGSGKEGARLRAAHFNCVPSPAHLCKCFFFIGGGSLSCTSGPLLNELERKRGPELAISALPNDVSLELVVKRALCVGRLTPENKNLQLAPTRYRAANRRNRRTVASLW